MLLDAIESCNSIQDIKKLSDGISVEEYPKFCKILESDKRKSVGQLIMRLTRKFESHEKELLRMQKIFEYEKSAQSQGYLLIAGIDEAGRGPLVGPVVAGAVVLDQSVDWTGIDDSKKLSEEKRNYFYDKIVKYAISYGVGMASHDEIDEINILNATKLAMSRALENVSADFLLIDAVKLTDIPIEQISIIKGDSLSASIAAASIIAKVTRDRMLLELHEAYPMYDFKNNKGYGTESHYKAIKEFGVINEHRRSFLKNIL
ncbi:MAG: ribonuclease HII [Clostridia bacterium]|nr:ribonuclease HII [Clostridia bacterium]